MAQLTNLERLRSSLILTVLQKVLRRFEFKHNFRDQDIETTDLYSKSGYLMSTKSLKNICK